MLARPVELVNTYPLPGLPELQNYEFSTRYGYDDVGRMEVKFKNISKIFTDSLRFPMETAFPTTNWY